MQPTIAVVGVDPQLPLMHVRVVVVRVKVPGVLHSVVRMHAPSDDVVEPHETPSRLAREHGPVSVIVLRSQVSDTQAKVVTLRLRVPFRSQVPEKPPHAPHAPTSSAGQPVTEQPSHRSMASLQTDAPTQGSPA